MPTQRNEQQSLTGQQNFAVARRSRSEGVVYASFNTHELATNAVDTISTTQGIPSEELQVVDLNDRGQTGYVTVQANITHEIPIREGTLEGGLTYTDDEAYVLQRGDLLLTFESHAKLDAWLQEGYSSSTEHYLTVVAEAEGTTFGEFHGPTIMYGDSPMCRLVLKTGQPTT